MHSDYIEQRPNEFEDLNREFHLEIYGANSDQLTELDKQIRLVWERFSRYRRYYWQARRNLCISDKEHRDIAKLWCSRDADGTELAIAQHIFSSIEDHIVSLGGNGSPPDPKLMAIAARYGLDDRIRAWATSE